MQRPILGTGPARRNLGLRIWRHVEGRGPHGASAWAGTLAVSGWGRGWGGDDERSWEWDLAAVGRVGVQGKPRTRVCVCLSRGLERAASGLEVPAWKAPTLFLFWLIGSHNSRHPATLRRLALHVNCLTPGDPPQCALRLRGSG